MGIKQFNASYVAEEDRVVWRITTTDDNEYRLLLTRAMVKDLLGLVRHVQLAQAVRQHLSPLAAEIAEFKQQVQLNSAKFTEFEPASRLPLGDQPLMVRKVGIQNEAGSHALELSLPGKLLKLPLADELAAQIAVVLQTIASHAKWDLLADSVLSGVEEVRTLPGQFPDTVTRKLLH